jgi:hypothetical protein
MLDKFTVPLHARAWSCAFVARVKIELKRSFKYKRNGGSQKLKISPPRSG